MECAAGDAWGVCGVAVGAAEAAGTSGDFVDCAAAGAGGAAGDADAGCVGVRPDSSRRVESVASSAVRIEMSLGNGEAQAGRITGAGLGRCDSVTATSVCAG